MRSVADSRARLLFFGCLAVAGYFAYVAIGGAIHNQQLARERDEAAQQVTALKEKKAYLEGVRSYAASDAYVEQQARRQLGYVREGEIPFVVISPALTNTGQPAAGEWWQRLFPR
ncbi:MAG: septum formation initiator family protein [Dehalococcoidia bacterium]|nr:septum formation initiator family protein [Dehalococcoidia bacterium]